MTSFCACDSLETSDLSEKYFVVSDGEGPLRVFFSREDAFLLGFMYIDTFDENGSYVKAYKLVNGEYIEVF